MVYFLQTEHDAQGKLIFISKKNDVSQVYIAKDDMGNNHQVDIRWIMKNHASVVNMVYKNRHKFYPIEVRYIENVGLISKEDEANMNAFKETLIKDKTVKYYDGYGYDGYSYIVFNGKYYDDVDMSNKELNYCLKAIKETNVCDLYNVIFCKSEGYFCVGYEMAQKTYNDYLDLLREEIKAMLLEYNNELQELKVECSRIKEILDDKEIYENRYKHTYKSYEEFISNFTEELHCLEYSISRCELDIEYCEEEINDIENANHGIVVIEKLS